MTRRPALIAAATAALALLGATLSTGPATAAPLTVERGRGIVVDARIVTVDAVSCSDGSAGSRTITAGFRGDHDVFSGPGYRVDSAFNTVSVDVSDSCTGETLSLGTGEANREGTVGLTNGGASGFVSESLAVYGPVPGEFPEAAVGLALTGNSRPARKVTGSAAITRDGVTFLRDAVRSRSADVTGSFVVSGTGLDYLDGRDLLDGASTATGTLAQTRNIVLRWNR